MDVDVNPGFKKPDEIRHMAFTLQFLLSLDILITSASYYILSSTGVHWEHQKTLDIVYLIWMLILTVSMLPMALTTPLQFAKLRFVFRMAHMISIISIYSCIRLSVALPIVIQYYICEIVYLVYGIYYQKMDWPGKWMAEMTDKWQEWKASNVTRGEDKSEETHATDKDVVSTNVSTV